MHRLCLTCTLMRDCGPNGPPGYLDGMLDGLCHGDAGRLPDQGRLAQPGFYVAASHCGRVAGCVDAHR